MSSPCFVRLGRGWLGSGNGEKRGGARRREPARGSDLVTRAPDSLAKGRASEAQLTAATDRYKLGTLLRVTRVSNGRQVTVRVTDTGLGASKSRIDLC